MVTEQCDIDVWHWRASRWPLSLSAIRHRSMLADGAVNVKPTALFCNALPHFSSHSQSISSSCSLAGWLDCSGQSIAVGVRQDVTTVARRRSGRMWKWRWKVDVLEACRTVISGSGSASLDTTTVTCCYLFKSTFLFLQLLCAVYEKQWFSRFNL